MIERDDIIRMVRQAGGYLSTDVNWMPIIGVEYAEKFAALVAEHEREAARKEANEQFQAEINHLKTQLMRYNTHDGAYKAAFLAGQMAARGGSWE